VKRDTFARLFKILGKPFRKPALGCVLISLLITGVVLLVRAQGGLQRLELIAYDQLVKGRMKVDARDDRIVLVGMTEDDLKNYGFPIPDKDLLDVIKKIDKQKPAITALDMYRDLREPRGQSDAQYQKFQEDLLALESVYVIERLRLVTPPPAFIETDRVLANNLPKDTQVDGVFRRGALVMETGVQKKKDAETSPTMESLSLGMAASYLYTKGVHVGYEPGPDGKLLLRLNKTIVPRLTPNAGGYVGLQVEDYEYLVDYEAPLAFRNETKKKNDPLGQFHTNTPYDYSFGDVLRDKVPSGTFAGKIVILATVMQSIKDSNPTPIDENLRGVQQHVLMTHQLLGYALDGKKPTGWWPEWGEILWITGCTLAGGILGLWLRSPLRLVPALALLLAGIIYTAYFAFQHGLWILLAAPFIGCVVAAALVTSYVVALERAKGRVVESLFAKHVSKKVATALIEQSDQFLDGGRMAARSFTGTVLFTDLAGFSTASEKLTAQQTMTWLNQYMDVMAALVEHYEGIVNKFIGDAIMAVFGAPIIHEEDEGINSDAARAIRCALHMRREVPIINARWAATAPDLPPVAMRIGIFTGALVNGSLGTSERLEWTVIGDTVNRANRLEAAGKEIKKELTEGETLCPILIGPEVFKRVGDMFETVPVADMTLKGISERVTVYRVLSERAPLTDFSPPLP
jgi:adenylate cyclase